MQTRSDAAQTLRCRHLQEQHKPLKSLKSKAPKEILKCGTVMAMVSKRSESFDNDFFFDIEAKRTCSKVRKLILKRSELVYIKEFDYRSEVKYVNIKL